MENKFLTEQALRKWKPVLDHKDMAPITDAHKRATMATLLENQEKAIKEQMLVEASTNAIGAGMSTLASPSGAINGYDPILIQLVRRAMPNLMAYDICGVQAMSAPTGLIFAMRSRYNAQSGTEAFYNEPNASWSGSTASSGNGTTAAAAGGSAKADGTGWNGLSNVDPFGYGDATTNPLSASGLTTGAGLRTNVGEELTPNEMAFTIERVGVQAATRALAASYSIELAQDLKAVHGLDAENELANILSTEILAEINREVVRNVYRCAKLGAQQADLYYKTVAGGLTTAGAGTKYGGVYDLIQDSDGRWSAEKFRGLMFQIERECNQIAKDTRRGKGNFIICSADVASALAMGGFLNISPALNVSLDVDDTGNTFAGTLNGKIKVYIDPYVDVSASTTAPNFVCVGYKGTSPYDAGLFYCPYVPLQMMRAVDTNTFQPKMAFKTRYGMVANPFAEGASQGFGALNARSNVYYRIFRVDNLHGVAS
jgi:Major capsid protein Gp23